MGVESVRAFLEAHAPDLEVLETAESTATVAEAAAAHGVAPGQSAKTLSLWLGGEVILVVLGGDAKLDNQKYKAAFGTKARMLSAPEVLERTGHAVGGVCPFGLTVPLSVFTDVSLRRYPVVIPAAGSSNTALRITPDRLASLVGATWVDVAQAPLTAGDR